MASRASPRRKACGSRSPARSRLRASASGAEGVVVGLPSGVDGAKAGDQIFYRFQQGGEDGPT